MSERILDRIIRGNFRLHPEMIRHLNMSSEKVEFNRREIMSDLSETVAFDVSNVTEFFYAGSDQEVWEIERDFPNLAPPFDHFWMESVAPSRIVSGVHGETPWSGDVAGWGCEFRVTSFGPDSVPYSQSFAHQAFDAFRRIADFRDVNGRPVQVQNSITDQDSGWLINIVPFLQVAGGGVIGPWFDYWLEVRHDGTVYRAAPVYPLFPVDSLFLGHLFTLAKPLLLAISFLHCRNVAVRDEPVSLSRPERRRLERAGIEPVRFKTLDIAPMRQVLADEGGSQSVGIQRALHICRGHFATYSQDKPLFGKHTGTFWVPAHVRGSVKHGVVAKDYRVLAS